MLQSPSMSDNSQSISTAPLTDKTVQYVQTHLKLPHVLVYFFDILCTQLWVISVWGVNVINVQLLCQGSGHLSDLHLFGLSELSSMASVSYYFCWFLLCHWTTLCKHQWLLLYSLWYLCVMGTAICNIILLKSWQMSMEEIIGKGVCGSGGRGRKVGWHCSPFQLHFFQLRCLQCFQELLWAWHRVSERTTFHQAGG